MSSAVERLTHHIPLEHARLLEIPRPYTLPVSLKLGGDALLIDETIVLAFKYAGEEFGNQLFITRHKSITVTLVKKDGSFRTYGFISPDNIKESFVELRLGFRPSRPRILISDEYKAVFQEDTETELKFSLESRYRIEAIPASGSVNHSQLLEDLSRKSQPQPGIPKKTETKSFNILSMARRIFSHGNRG